MNCIGAVNEWGTLKEVIVGNVDNAMHHHWQRVLQRSSPRQANLESANYPCGPISEKILQNANAELLLFEQILRDHQVVIHKPDKFPHHQPYATPLWNVGNGVSCANPRDSMLLTGDTIIECPMNDRGRYFETFPFRSILHECFSRGARWLAAPKPMLTDSSFEVDKSKLLPTEAEPVFDAADFLKIGRNKLLGQFSNATNRAGISWLKRTLGPDFEISLLSNRRTDTLHIDTTIVLLDEGEALINTEFINKEELPKTLSNWQIYDAPKPVAFWADIDGVKVVSDWMSLNMLNLGGRKLIVEQRQEPLIKFLEARGFSVITCPFEHYYALGGSFHCATLDIAREPI